MRLDCSIVLRPTVWWESERYGDTARLTLPTGGVWWWSGAAVSHPHLRPAQASSTDQASSKVVTTQPNGVPANGTNGVPVNGTNGAHVNGINGVNGSAVKNPVNGTANGTYTNGVASLTNTITITPPKDAAEGVEGYLDPCDAGQLEACAAERITEMDAAASKGGDGAGGVKVTTPTTAAGTPYRNPGGRWSQFRNYSVFQVGEECCGKGRGTGVRLG